MLMGEESLARKTKLFIWKNKWKDYVSLVHKYTKM